MKIAISGSHSTGKTTLVNELSKIIELPIIRESAREVIQTLLVNPNNLTTLEKQKFQIDILNLQIDKETSLTCFLSDRTVLDNLAYAEELEDKLLLEQLKFKAIEFNKANPYDLVFYIPIEFDIENDGVRPLCPEFRKLIDQRILNLLVSNNIDYTVLSGSLENRINQFMNVLYDKIKTLI